MAFPSEATAIAFASLSDIVDHVGMSPEAFAAVVAKTGDPADKHHNWALLDAATIRAAVAAARHGPQEAPVALTPMQAAQVGLTWRIARRIAFVQGGGTWSAWPDTNPLADPLLAPAGQQVLPVQGTGYGGPSPLTRTVKVGAVLDQGDTSKVKLANSDQWDRWHAAYVTVTGEPPDHHLEPTLEQISALQHRTASTADGGLELEPYADFAARVPFGRRGLRAMKFRTWAPAGDGTYFSRELPGPSTPQQWEAAWDLFTVAAIMLDIASPMILDRYKKHIKALVTEWADCWHLNALADDKMRAEQWERIRRHIINEIDG